MRSVFFESLGFKRSFLFHDSEYLSITLRNFYWKNQSNSSKNKQINEEKENEKKSFLKF